MKKTLVFRDFIKNNQRLNSLTKISLTIPTNIPTTVSQQWITMIKKKDSNLIEKRKKHIFFIEFCLKAYSRTNNISFLIHFYILFSRFTPLTTHWLKNQFVNFTKTTILIFQPCKVYSNFWNRKGSFFIFQKWKSRNNIELWEIFYSLQRILFKKRKIHKK